MEQSYDTLPASHSVGSVPAIVTEEKQTAKQEVSGSNLQIHPPSNAGNGGSTYRRIGSTNDEGGQQPTNNWKGVFNISSYMQYFNVDTDIVLNRLAGALDPSSGDFLSKIDANPDLRSDKSALWAFDVNYMRIAAGSIYVITDNSGGVLRRLIAIIAGGASGSFVSMNLGTYMQTVELKMVVVSAFVLQMSLSVFIKMWFFT